MTALPTAEPPTDTASMVAVTPTPCASGCPSSSGHGGNLVLVLIIVVLLIFIWGYSIGHKSGSVQINMDRHR